MSSGFGLMCCICFKGLTPAECFNDPNNDQWDVCNTPMCAIQAGVWPKDRIEELNEAELNLYRRIYKKEKENEIYDD